MTIKTIQEQIYSNHEIIVLYDKLDNSLDATLRKYDKPYTRITSKDFSSNTLVFDTIIVHPFVQAKFSMGSNNLPRKDPQILLQAPI